MYSRNGTINYSSMGTILNSTKNYRRRCLTPLGSNQVCNLHHYDLTIVGRHYHLITSSDRFPVPVKSAVKSYLTDCWLAAKRQLSNRALRALGDLGDRRTLVCPVLSVTV